MTNISVVLCEGPHDIAFLRKVLRANDYNHKDACKLSDFPKPFNSLLINEAKKSNVPDLNLQEVKTTLLPLVALEKGGTYFFLYSLGGDGRKDKRSELVNKVSNLIPENGEIPASDNAESVKYAIIYFFDADEQGVDRRLLSINSEVKDIFESEEDIFTANAKVHSVNEKMKLGCYVFHEQGKETGKLEDVVLPLMKNGNETIFENAEVYIDDNPVASKTKFCKKKSTIGIAGQLKRSGVSNFDIIKHTNYITNDKVKTDSTCIKIAEFFESICTSFSS